MSSDKQHPTDLLPWYVNGSLKKSELDKVRQHLESCPICQQEVEFLKLIRQEIKNTSKLSHPGKLAKSRFLKSIKKTAHEPKKTSVENKRIENKYHIFWKPLLATAALLIITLQTIIILQATPRQNNAGLQLLGQNAELSIQFHDNVSIDAINKLLTKFQARIINGPIETADGRIFYEIDLEAINKNSSNQSIKMWIDKLRRQHETIKYVNSTNIN